MKKRLKLFFLYYAIIAILLLEGYTFSKYISTVTAEATIRPAQFNFKLENTEAQQMEIDLKDTLLANTYSEDIIVPGTSGEIDLKLDFSNIEVTTNYNIKLDKTNTKLPENLKIYTDAAHTIEFNGYTGTTTLDTTTVTRKIYWKWNYTTDDETEEWMGQPIKIILNIVAEQRTN